MFIPQARAHSRSTPISKRDDRNAKHLNKDRHPHPRPQPSDVCAAKKKRNPLPLSLEFDVLLTTATHNGFSEHQRGSLGARGVPQATVSSVLR